MVELAGAVWNAKLVAAIQVTRNMHAPHRWPTLCESVALKLRNALVVVI